MQFGTLPAELTRKSIELFAREVIPHFAARRRRYGRPLERDEVMLNRLGIPKSASF